MYRIYRNSRVWNEESGKDCQGILFRFPCLFPYPVVCLAKYPWNQNRNSGSPSFFLILFFRYKGSVGKTKKLRWVFLSAEKTSIFQQPVQSMCEKLLRIIFCASFRIVNRKADASSSATFCFFFGHLLFYFPTRFGQILLWLPVQICRVLRAAVKSKKSSFQDK